MSSVSAKKKRSHVQAFRTQQREYSAEQLVQITSGKSGCNFSRFSSANQPIIRPTGAGQLDATGAIKGFIADGLFIGQPKEFTQLLLELALEADEARRQP